MPGEIGQLLRRVSLFHEATRARLAALTQYFVGHGVTDPAQAWHRAVIAVGRTVRQQAFIMGFSDTFFLLGVALLVALAATLLLKKSDHVQGAGAH